MVRRLGLGKNNHLTYTSLALNPRYDIAPVEAFLLQPESTIFFFSYFSMKAGYGYSLKVPCRDTTYEYTQNVFMEK